MKKYFGVALRECTVACIVVMAASVGAEGCGGTPEGETPEAVHAPLLGGTPTFDRPEVVQFLMPMGSACTATMISSRTFLTASHCIDEEPMVRGGRIVIGKEWPPSIGVDRTFSLRYNVDDHDSDLAVGRTTSDVPGVTPATIASDEPGAGYLTKVGYGCTQDRGPTCSPADRTFISYYYDGGYSDITAQGDSGGPTFIGLLNDRGPIVRVGSAYYNDITAWPGGGPVIFRGADIGANPVVHREEILQMSTALNNDYGLSSRTQIDTVGYIAASSRQRLGDGVLLGDGEHGIEAIQLWSPSNGVAICYRVHVRDVGWQSEVCDGLRSGIPGNGVDAVRIRMQWPSTYSIKYRVFRDDNLGFERFQVNGDMAGSEGGPTIRMLWVTLVGL